ncbi:MAG TPA: AHH domain-containing protein [Croceibacterium sp.]|nr:AHH domain-containing protein [Croceibacterium sp.]
MSPAADISELHADGRARISFRAVNRKGVPGHDPGLQRHHLLPRQLLQRRCFGRLFDAVGHERVGFNDFRRNGLLLPAAESAALRLALPLHRGPHRNYNELVIERIGQIEHGWSLHRFRAPEVALGQANMRLTLLQRALRRSLLGDRRPFRLSSKCPLGTGYDFSELDAMAEKLWYGTQEGDKPALALRSIFA